LIIAPLGGCTGYKSSTPAPTRTYLIYMNGSDLETEYGSASADIKEIMGAKIDDTSTIYLQTGGTKDWQNPQIADGANERFEIKANELEKLETNETASMGSAATLSDFIIWGMEHSPGDETVLILWNHGGGAITGFGKDELHRKDTLLLGELAQAVKTSYNATGKKLNIIAFDACLMASIENVDLLSPYCDYIVASEELVPDFGFDYKAYFNGEGSAPDAKTAAVKLAETYYSHATTNGARDNVTISVIDASMVPALMSAFEGCLPDFKSNVTAMDTGSYQIAEGLMKTMTFGGQSANEGYSNMVDLMSLMNETNVSSADAFEDLKTAVSEAVVFKKNGYLHTGACGISIYYPKYITSDTGYDLELYRGLNFSSAYADIVTGYVQASGDDTLDALIEDVSIEVDGVQLPAKLISSKGLYNVYTAVKTQGEVDESYRIVENRLFKTKDISCIFSTVNTKYGKSEQKYQVVPEGSVSPDKMH